MLIDTHLHLIDKARLSYPWLADAPALDRDWSYRDYAVVARRVGISGVLHMEVDVAEADIDAETTCIQQLMQEPDSLMLGAISSARPEQEGFDAWLDGIDRTVVKGLRRVLHVVPDAVSQSNLFRENTRAMGQKGLPFDMCVLARQLPLAMALADAAPNTQFVLDHCGVPDIAGGGYADWASDITELAKRPNVAAKISGITAYTGGPWTLDTLRPYVEHVIQAFGWDRVVWGSDSPVCTLNASLEQWVAATFALMSGASKEERAKLFSANATRIWRL